MYPTHTLDSPESSQHPTFEAPHCTHTHTQTSPSRRRTVRTGTKTSVRVSSAPGSTARLAVSSLSLMTASSGIVTIEDLLIAAADSTIASLINQDAPFVAPWSSIRKWPAWHAVRHSEAALAVVDENGRFAGLIPTHRLLAVLLAEHGRRFVAAGGFYGPPRLRERAVKSPCAVASGIGFPGSCSGCVEHCG